MPDRRRVRGPQLQQDGRGSHVLTKLGRTALLQIAPFLAAQKGPKRSAGAGRGLGVCRYLVERQSAENEAARPAG